MEKTTSSSSITRMPEKFDVFAVMKKLPDGGYELAAVPGLPPEKLKAVVAGAHAVIHNAEMGQPTRRNWPTENIAQILDLTQFSSEEEAVNAVREAFALKKESERQRTIESAFTILSHRLDIPAFGTEPLPTLEELKEKVQRMDLSRLKDELKIWRTLIETCKNFPQVIRQKIEHAIKIQILNPENVKAEIDSAMALLKNDFELVEKAVPFIQEIINVLVTRVTEMTVGRTNLPARKKGWRKNEN